MMEHTDTKYIANLKDKKGNVYYYIVINNPDWIGQKNLWAHFYPDSVNICSLYIPKETATDEEMFKLGFYKVESISRSEYYVESFEVYHAE